MSTLEVLQSCPSQKKALLNSLGAVGPSDDHFIVFPIDTSEHPLLPPSSSLSSSQEKLYEVYVHALITQVSKLVDLSSTNSSSTVPDDAYVNILS